MDNILQVGAWLTGDPEHEFYRIASSLRAFHVNAKGTIFRKLELGSRLRHIGRRKGAALAHLQGRRSVLSLDDIQIYLQNFVHPQYVLLFH